MFESMGAGVGASNVYLSSPVKLWYWDVLLPSLNKHNSRASLNEMKQASKQATKKQIKITQHIIRKSFLKKKKKKKKVCCIVKAESTKGWETCVDG